MTTPIRVLCVFSRLDRGGAESMCMDLYRHIDRSKVQFDFVKHTSCKCMFEDEIAALGGRIYEAPQYKIINHFQYRQWWKNHLTVHPEHQIVHGHYYTVSAVYLSIARKLGRIAIAHSHNTRADSKGIVRLYKALMIKQVKNNCDYCFACSRKAGEWMFKSRPFTVLNNAIDVSKYVWDSDCSSQVRRELNIEKGCTVIGTVGRLVPQKNPHGVIDIFAAIHRMNPNTKMLWVGKNSMKDEVDEHIKKLRIGDAYIFTGVRNDVSRLLQAMDVFILPSFYEGLPVVGIEAQSAGLTCYFSDAITKDAKITDECHFLPIDDAERWAKEICAADLSHRRDTSEQIIAAGYDIHTTAEWLQNFYFDLETGR